MREFKTLLDIFKVGREIITRDEFEKLKKSSFVYSYSDVTFNERTPGYNNCTTYYIKIKARNDYYGIYVFVKDDKKEVKSIRDWNSMVDSIFFDDNN